jgi:hypothetical protein
LIAEEQHHQGFGLPSAHAAAKPAKKKRASGSVQSLYAGAVLLPDAVMDHWSMRRSVPDTGFTRLAVGLMEDVTLIAESWARRPLDLQEETDRWVHMSNADYAQGDVRVSISFETICDYFGISAEWARETYETTKRGETRQLRRRTNHANQRYMVISVPESTEEERELRRAKLARRIQRKRGDNGNWQGDEGPGAFLLSICDDPQHDGSGCWPEIPD